MTDITEPSAPSEGTQREQDAAPTVPYTRLLASAFKKSSLEVRDGGLLVRDVPMLAAGTWTDSAVQTPLNYPEKTLREYAANWSDNTGWTRHTGGSPRAVTDKVAEAINPRFQDGAVVADVFVHGATQQSRDTIELIKRKLIAFVSVEHTGDERYNASTRQLEATSINFSGFAFVNKGACKLCRINEEAPLASVPTEQVPKPEVPQEENMSELEELKSQVAELTRKLAESIPAATKVAEPVVDTSRELEEAASKAAAEQAAAAMKQVSELQAQVKELMSRPAAPVVATVPEPMKELKEPEFAVRIDRKSRFVEVY